MTNSTAEHWSVNGYGLNKYSRNLSSWGGSRQGAMARTLGTLELPTVDGAMVSVGSYGPRTLELSGWVIGAEEDGRTRGIQKFKDNWRELREVFTSPATDGLLKLQKQVQTSDETFAVNAEGYLADGLEPEMTTPARAEWAANVLLPYPFFTRTMPEIPLTNGAWKTIEVAGDESSDFILKVTGAATELKLEFGLHTQAVSRHLHLPGSSSGFTMLTREKTLKAGTTSINGKARFKGGRFWKMPPGTRHIRFTTTTGTPTVTVTPIARYW